MGRPEFHAFTLAQYCGPPTSDQRQTTPDLGLLAWQQQRILGELANLRDDLAVLTAIAMRQDPTLSALLTEVRATHPQHNRLANRVRTLEAEHSS